MPTYSNMTKAEKDAKRIIRNVDAMQKNREQMADFRNYPLAQETMTLIEGLGDAEEPLGKAYACNAVIEQLSEYDTPRFVLGLLRRELEWVEASEEKSDWLTPDYIRGEIARLEAYIDEDGLSMEEFCKQFGRHLLFDPIERSPRWEEIYYEVEAECDRRLGDAPRGMGFCFGYWAVKQGVLATYGIDWRSPQAMNPHVMFD